MDETWSRVRYWFEDLLFGKDEEGLDQKSDNRKTVDNASPTVSRTSNDEIPDGTCSASASEKIVEVSERECRHATNDNQRARSAPNAQRSRAIPRWISPRTEGQPSPIWKPSFLQPKPLAGLCALLVASLCIFASLAILTVSDSQPVANWPIQPTVYLALVSAVAHSALALAHNQAVPVSWFYRATRGGSIHALERQWHVTNTLMGALLHSRPVSLLVVGSIATSFVVIDAPLLQRASSVQVADTISNKTVSLRLSPELPTGFSGSYTRTDFWQTQAAAEVCTEWEDNKPIALSVPECKGSCQMTVQAPGLAKRNCSSQTWPITSAMVHDPTSTWGQWKTFGQGGINSLVTDNPAFYVNLINGQVPGYPPNATREAAFLTVGLLHWVNWEGAYIQTSCYLHPAILEYEVIIEKNILTFVGAAGDGQVVKIANNTPPADIEEELGNEHESLPTTIDGLTGWLSPFVNANTSVAIPTNPNTNTTYTMDITTANAMSIRHIQGHASHSDLSFRDPTKTVVSKFNEMMVRGGILAASQPDVEAKLDPGVSVHQTIQARQTIREPVFHSDLRWYAGAAIIEIATILLVLPMFWCFWTLGSNTTLSPFNVALAFDTPLLQDVNSATGARGVVQEVGTTRVKFGMVLASGTEAERGADDTAPGRLGFSEENRVVRPRRGLRFSK